RDASGESGSIIIVVATDAPLLPHQLKRVARRAALGLARTGSESGNGSGDLFLAFSTANPGPGSESGTGSARLCRAFSPATPGAGSQSGTPTLTMLPNDRIDPLFGATVQA